jgi:hypothetical protein
MELCNFRETLRKLKGEVDVDLARLDWVTNNLEGIGSGQGCRCYLVQKVVGPKGKEKWLKPKRKVVFKPKVGWAQVLGPRALSRAILLRGWRRRKARRPYVCSWQGSCLMQELRLQCA